MPNPCLDCGVCCMTYRIAFHWSEVNDETGVPSHLVEPFRRHEVIMIGTMGPNIRCTALKTDEATGHLGCSIHGRHPSVCRSVDVGSDQCMRARAKHGLSELAASDIAHAYEGPNPPAVATENAVAP